MKTSSIYYAFRGETVVDYFSLLNAETVHVMTARIDILVAGDDSQPGLSSVLYPVIKDSLICTDFPIFTPGFVVSIVPNREE